MKNLSIGVVIGLLLGGFAARAELVNRFTPPPPVQIIREIVHEAAPKIAPGALDSVIRLYGPDGHATREYTGSFSGIEQTPGAVKFKLENGRTVILGGSFSVEEIPHQE
jgi:hypothetical protein